MHVPESILIEKKHTLRGQKLGLSRSVRLGCRKERSPEGGVGLVPGAAEALDVVPPVEQHDHGLSEHDGEPEDDVAHLRALEPLRGLDQRHLGHHAAEGEELEVAEGDADNEFVQHSRQQEDDERRRPLGPSAVREGQVDVGHHPRVHRKVPRAPEEAHRGRVPPVAVELPVPEAHKLGQDVEVEVEDAVEAEYPHDEVGHRDLEQPLCDEDGVPERLAHLQRPQRVPQPRGDVLDADEVDGAPDADELHHAPHHPLLAHALAPGVGDGEDEGGRADKVVELAQRGPEPLVFGCGEPAELVRDQREGYDLHHADRREDERQQAPPRACSEVPQPCPGDPKRRDRVEKV
mmetsp:Transcript_17018/g.35975  ORF Transcript_17018/g.35975 Transcript_17018/m.35975 type:complete len:348 (+) Transcript_17018:170-1213(+)|eukprot:CAMPEP_0172166912 /NCGR_PEP_ID=MMETSP1050-20130122/9270_1 /TAXON_ID=233186 /ORGANISM="Cryptomonas curvata, Strain CCAP979/52" /LENGTH=347 /DNA_ID=CAMNT_0012837625 /DNA_START=757 /DNA_END=1800 /DNA_ORIENTATION=-